MRISILLITLMASSGCSGGERSAPGEPTPNPAASQDQPAPKVTSAQAQPPSAAGVPVPPGRVAPDLVQLRKDLSGLADVICACSDATCASKPAREASIWEKELILVKDNPDYQPYVTSVGSDAAISAARARITECSRRIKW